MTAPPAAGSGEGRSLGGRSRSVALWLFFGSVGVNALLGIAGLLGLGLFDGRLLGTSLAVTGALVVALLCLPARERGLLGPIPSLSAATGAVAFALVAVSVWASDGDTVGRVIGTLLTLACAGTLASLAALARLPERRRITLYAAYGLLGVSALLIVLRVWVEIDNDWYPRLVGVALVVLAALLVSLPVLHRLARDAQGAVGDGPLVAFCPFCGAPLEPEAGAGLHRCGSCRRSFTVAER